MQNDATGCGIIFHTRPTHSRKLNFLTCFDIDHIFDVFDDPWAPWGPLGTHGPLGPHGSDGAHTAPWAHGTHGPHGPRPHGAPWAPGGGDGGGGAVPADLAPSPANAPRDEISCEGPFPHSDLVAGVETQIGSPLGTKPDSNGSPTSPHAHMWRRRSHSPYEAVGSLPSIISGRFGSMSSTNKN